MTFFGNVFISSSRRCTHQIIILQFYHLNFPQDFLILYLPCMSLNEALKFISLIFLSGSRKRIIRKNVFFKFLPHVTFIKWAWRGFLNRILRRKKLLFFLHFYVKTQTWKWSNNKTPIFHIFCTCQTTKSWNHSTREIHEVAVIFEILLVWFMALSHIWDRDNKNRRRCN